MEELKLIVDEVYHGQEERHGQSVLWEQASDASDSTVEGGHWRGLLKVH